MNSFHYFQSDPSFPYNLSLSPTSNQAVDTKRGAEKSHGHRQRERKSSRQQQKGNPEKMEKTNTRKIDTTLGELIAAASEVAFEYSENDRDAYILAQLALIEMLRKTTHPIDLNKVFESLSSPSQLLH
jgi:hypothetical protein